MAKVIYLKRLFQAECLGSTDPPLLISNLGEEEGFSAKRNGKTRVKARGEDLRPPD
jgi:hypothetical protein